MDSRALSVRADSSLIQSILTRVQQRIGPQKFNAWFRHGTRVSVADGFVRVAVPNPFVAHWIETHYQSDIQSAAGEETGAAASVVVMVDPSLNAELRKGQLDLQADMVHRAAEGRARPVEAAGRAAPLPHRLEDFVLGESNRLAYSAAAAVIRGGQTPFVHLFIHGSCGVGKTHLLQGICNAATDARARTIRWRYVTGEQFTNEFVSALRNKQGAAFRRRYRNLDLLAIDDVHFLSAKKATQEEFLHTFNAIQSGGKRIVLASDAQPRLVGEFSEQLVNRFVAGMVVKIDSPDPELRLKILARKVADRKLKTDRQVLEYIAAHVRGSVRELEGAVIKLTAISALKGAPVTLEMAQQALADHLARTDSAITLGDIEATVAAFYGITPADLHSTRRTQTVSAARMVAMFLARRHTRMSYPEIGRAMGKNHSSVIQAVQRMERLLGAGGKITWLTAMGPKSMPAEEIVKLLTEQFA